MNKKILAVTFITLLTLSGGITALAAGTFNPGPTPDGMATSKTIPEFTGKVITWVMGTIGAICVVMIIVGAVMMIVGGVDDTRKKGLSIIFWSVIGLVLVILAWTIVNIVGGIASGF